MKIIFELKDYINAITPFLNGCSFKMIYDRNGITKMDVGCWCLPNLLTGAQEQFYRLWQKNGDQAFRVDITPEMKYELLKIPPCTRCGGSLQWSYKAD